jgi:eukaryotic-like serine/threonine-protein kinase
MRFKPVPFGKYYLLDRVNTGGMAEVYRAKAFGVEGFERIVAVKRILPTIAANTDFIKMFIDEAKLAVQLNHANIAQIFDLGKVDGSYFIALEYVHGRDLRAVFDLQKEKGEQLPIELCCYVMMKICEGLDYAHRKRDANGRALELVHRDVSPQNMLISFDGDVKLIDFGIAKAANNSSNTRTGVLKGKFGYLSPEQVRGQPIDQRSDIFGIGIVLYELLTGERLFVGDSDLSTIEKVRNVEVAPPRQLNPDISEQLERTVLKALARNKDERFQTALELHDALQDVLLEESKRGQPFGRKELRAFMLAQFPEDAARDPEAVGDLEGAESHASSSTDVTPIVAPTESNAVYKETRDVPEEANKNPQTILGMPAVLPPADLAAPGRNSAPPPQHRRGGTRPPAPPGSARPAGLSRTVPPPPPRTQPPAPPARAQTRSSLPAPVAPGTVPQQPARSVPPPPPNVQAAGRGPSLNMAWDDDEELSTQIYDRPDDYENIEAGFDDLSALRLGDRDERQERSYPQPNYPARQPFPAASSYMAPPQHRSPGSYPANSHPAVQPTRSPTNPPGSVPANTYPAQQQYAPPPGSYSAQQQPQQHLYATTPGVGGYDPNNGARPNAGYDQNGNYQNGGYSPFPGEQTPPPGVQISPRAYSNSEPPPAPPAGSLRAPPTATQTFTMNGLERPDSSRNPLFAMLAVAAVVLLCFVGYVFLARTEPGVVQVAAHPADAKLLFDGKPVGSSSPFVVTGVSPSDKHTIELQKAGYRSWSQEVQVQAGQTLQLSVPLQPAEGAPEAVAGVTPNGQVATGGFSLETSPPGAVVALDGQDLGGVTPLRVGNLLARTYDVKVKLAGFKEHNARVDVRAGVDQSLPRVMLEPERVRVRVSSEPSGADAVVVRGSERRTLGRTPIDVTLDNDGSSWALVVSKSGYESYEQAISIEDGVAELSMRAVLARKSGEASSDAVASAPVAAAPVAEPPKPARASASASTDDLLESATSSSAKAPAAPAGGGGQGTLRINARPWAQVVIDGRPVGNTPQTNIALPAGNHRVQLVNPEFNLKKNLTVTIKAGQVETQIISLQ